MANGIRLHAKNKNGIELDLFPESHVSLIFCDTKDESTGATVSITLDELLNEYANEIDRAATIYGSGAPTELTVGAVGQFYLDEDSLDLYFCSATNGGYYVWEPLKSGGGGISPQIISLTDEGATVTCTNGTTTLTQTATENGATFDIPSFGTWTLQATLGNKTTNPMEVVVDTVKPYTVALKFYAYLFGFDLDTSDSNPSTRVTYPADVDNSAFAKAAMNFSTGVFNYGDWPSVPGEMFMPKPCMLTYAGAVDHYLNANDYTKREDGITASSVASTSFGGNAMMEWSKIYTHRETVGNIYKFRCSDVKQGDDWECWCNYDRNNNEIDHFYTPIYFGSNVSSRMRSISGQTNLISATADTEITYAKANGSDWYTEVLSDRLLIQDLLVMITKTTAIQEAIGSGRTSSSNSAAIGQGTMNTKGLFWGSNNGTDGVKVFGMENWWGNLYRRTAGWINNAGTQMVKLTRGTKDGSTAAEYNTDGSGYLTVAGATPSGSSGGYISSMKTESYGRIPVTASGSSSTYEADGMYFTNSSIRYALVGGHWGTALLAGPFYVLLHTAPSLASATFGAALSCKPLAA